MALQLQFILSNDVEEIRDLVSQGFCPVECALGDQNVVDQLTMDHHGKLSDLEAVATRAYRDHYGVRKNDLRFVGTGVADADMCFAVAALAGLLPHPSREVDPSLPPHVQASLTRDLSDLAATVARYDRSPIGLDILRLPYGDRLLTWNFLAANIADSLEFTGGVMLWRTLTTGNPTLDPFIDAASTAEANRRDQALRDMYERAVRIGDVLVIKGSRVFGFNEWYARKGEDTPFEAVAGWLNPVVIAWIEGTQGVTMGCPNQDVANELFNTGGLKNVFKHLQPKGWGGSEAVGGGPRGAKLTWEQVEEAAGVVNNLLYAHC